MKDVGKRKSAGASDTAATAKVHRGGCLCGAIRFEATGPAAKPHTCSCSMCRRHSGALTVPWVEFARSAVAWTGPGGMPKTYRSSPASSRAFCGTCGSTLGAIDDAPTIGLVLGAFDPPLPKDFVPTSHSYVGGLPAWWHVEVADRPLRARRKPAG